MPLPRAVLSAPPPLQRLLAILVSVLFLAGLFRPPLDLAVPLSLRYLEVLVALALFLIILCLDLGLGLVDIPVTGWARHCCCCHTPQFSDIKYTLVLGHLNKPPGNKVSHQLVPPGKDAFIVHCLRGLVLALCLGLGPVGIHFGHLNEPLAGGERFGGVLTLIPQPLSLSPALM